MLALFKNTWRKMDEYKQVIRLYQIILIILLGFIYLQHTHLNSALTSQRIYVTPTLQAEGGYTQSNIISDELLFGFAFRTFSEINTWGGTDDVDEYKRQIEKNRYFLTPAYYEQLMSDFSEKKSKGELARIRVLAGYHGQDFESVNITKLSVNTWEVDLTLRLVERLENTAVKDVLIQFPLKVVRSNLSPDLNPYGLVIDGFVSEPRRLKDMDKKSEN